MLISNSERVKYLFMVELNLLFALTAFVECGTLSKAAKKLHTSQPALTRSIKKLEQELGVSLFVRSKNHLSLNDTGTHAAEYAQLVMKHAVDFEKKGKLYDKSLHTISIGFCSPVPQTLLTPIINTVFDGMTISADMSDDALFVQNLKSGSYDLAVLHFDPEDPDIYVKKCGHEELYISLMPDDPLSSFPGQIIHIFRLHFICEEENVFRTKHLFLLQIRKPVQIIISHAPCRKKKPMPLFLTG